MRTDGGVDLRGDLLGWRSSLVRPIVADRFDDGDREGKIRIRGSAADDQNIAVGLDAFGLSAQDRRYTTGFYMVVNVDNFHLFLGEKLHLDRTEFEHIELLEQNGILYRFAV